MRNTLVITLLSVVATAVAILCSGLSPIIKVTTQCSTARIQSVQEYVYEASGTGGFVAMLEVRPIVLGDVGFVKCNCSQKQQSQQRQDAEGFLKIPQLALPHLPKSITLPLVCPDLTCPRHPNFAAATDSPAPPVPPPNFI